MIKGDNQIGKKTDCPKCKYRFTVPSRDGAEDAGYDVVDTPKKKGNPKALVGILLGVVGVAVLGVGGFLMFGGDKEETPVVKTTPTVRPATPTVTPKEDPKTPENKANPITPKNDPKKGNGAPADPTAVGDPNAGKKTEVPKAKPPEIIIPVDAAKMKDASNLLPGQTVALIRFNMDRFRSTPFYSAFFDKAMLDFFATTLTIEASDVENVHICMVDADRDPFVVIRTKKPFSSRNIYERMDIKEASISPINQRTLFELKSNAFVTAVGKALNADSILGARKTSAAEEEKRKADEKKPMALTIYDSQTLIIGDLNIVARWLGELDKNGDPPFQTALVPAAAAAPGAPGAPAAPAAPAAPVDPKAGGRGEGGRGGGGAPPAPGAAPTPGGASDPNTLYDSKPDYRTVRPEFKQLLNRVELNDKVKPVIVYADIIEQRILEDKESIEDLGVSDQIWLRIRQLSPAITIFGASIQDLDRGKLVGTIVAKCTSEKDAEETNKKRFVPFIDSNFEFFQNIFGTRLAGWTVSNPGGATGAAGPRGGASGQPMGEENFTASKLTITNNDVYVTVDADFKIAQANYDKLIQPFIVSAITQVKGRMAVLSGETSWYSLSTKFARVVAERKQFPQGTLPRDTKPERFGLPWPPDHRTSFIVELLPYLNQGGLRSTIQDKKFAWYDKQNMKAATTWIPQLLVPYYPQSAWRANHPLADQGQAALGATNFVALSGVGLDSARFNPTNPAHAKLVGITGYEWGSNPAEITDGMSNTIYMIQVPPGFTRPWIAGGGATVMGVDDKAANPVSDFVHTEPSGKRGTYALMADGSVRHIPENIDPAVFKAMVTRAGGEALGDLDAKLPKLPMPKGMETELKGGGSKSPIAKKPDNRDKIDAQELQKLQGK